jgi:hypothetical protein
VRGTIEPGASLEGAVPVGGMIFVSARQALPDGGGGPLLAATRLTYDRWPLAFELGAADVLLADRVLAGELHLDAWYDQDGDACTAEVGDLEGEARATVPADGVRITLSVVRAVPGSRCGR